MSLFVAYTIMCFISFVILSGLGYFTFINKKINMKNWVFIIVGLLLFQNFTMLFNKGMETNNRLKTEFKVPKDMYSTMDIESDSILSDEILYSYMLNMRVPHSKVALCQAKIESSQYGSVLFKRQSNLFGMKIPSNRPTTGVDGKAGYQAYNIWTESVTDYILWQYSHNVDKLSQSDYITYLGKIYAEDPQYTVKIKKMLNTINFNKLEN